MADVNANINIDIDSSGALSELSRLEGKINSFQRSINAGNTAAIAQQASLNRALMDGINSTGMFAAKQVDAISSAAKFTNALEKNKLSLGEYTRYAASQMPGLSRVFRKEFDTMQQVAESRVKAISTQYVALGKNVDGVTRSIAAVPATLERGYGSQMAMTLQRQQMFNKLIDDGSTKLLNWGKNTQWAGRQLMVGLSLPMAAFGAAAAAAFMELDKATVQLERVYGDLSTTRQEVEQNTEAIKALGSEYTKYGISVADTVGLGARAAATGATNKDLLAATEQTLRFATLGQIDYNQSLDTTIALQTAFGISSEELASKINFLNAVENQTILTIEDMSMAIPRVATVVKGLGGSVEDLAVMMTAMREGGVSAENAANGLKSGLASMINPTNAANEALSKMGINLEAIVSQYRGDLMGTIVAFGEELDSLGSFERQQALEKVFGKYQYARMSALFDNITSKTGQAARAMDLAGMSAEELASIAEKELGTIAESSTVKFQAAMEQLKLSIAPLGEAFLKVATPALEMVSKIADAFNSLPDPIKNAIGIATVAIAGIGPVLLMGIGLMGNLVANIVKGIQWWRKLAANIKGNADQFNYMSKAELDALTATEALEGSTVSLTNKLYLQAQAVRELNRQYGRFISAAGIAAGAMSAVPAARAGRGPKLATMAQGGTVPGSGSGDKIPALLEPGETVITKKASQKYGPVLAAMNAGTLPGYALGNTSGGGTVEVLPGVTANVGAKTLGNPQSLINLLDSIDRWTAGMDLSEDQIISLRAAIGDTEQSAKSLSLIFKDLVSENISTRGERTGEGTQSGTSLPRQFKSQRDEFTKQLEDDAEYVADLFAGKVMSSREMAELSAPERRMRRAEGYIEERQLANLTKTASLHIDKPEEGRKAESWFTDPIRPDLNAPNAFTERMMLSADTWNDISIKSQNIETLMSRNSEEFSSLGITLDDIGQTFDRIAEGGEAVNEKQAIIRQRFAEWDAELSRDILSTGAAGRTALGTNPETIHVPTAEAALTARRREQEKLGEALSRRYDQSGMGAPSAAIQTSVNNAVDDIEQSIDEALERNSPPERVARVGDDVDEALAQGIERSSQIPAASAKKLANQTADELEETMRTRMAEIEMLSAEKAQMKATPTAAGAALSQYSDYPLMLETKMRELAAQSKEMNDIYTRMTANGASTVQILEAMNQQEMVRKGQLEAEYDNQIRQAKTEQEQARVARQTQIEQEKELAAKRRELAAQQSQTVNAAADAAVTTRGGALGKMGGFLGRNSGKMGMALGMGSMIPFMAQNEEGKFMGVDANALGMGMGGAGMALDMLGMEKLAGAGGIIGKVAAGLAAFAGPLAIATAAVTAAGVAIYAWRNSVDTAARKAAELGANLGGTSNALNKMAQMLGKQTPAQTRTQVQVGDLTATQQENFGEYQSLIDSEAGQELITGLKEATSADRFKMLGDYVTSAVAAGIMEYDFAEGFVKTISTELGDAVMGKNVLSALSEFKDLASNTEGMLQIANKRLESAEGSADMRAVLAGGDVSNAQASSAVGQALQGIQDFANAAAVAEQEFADGTISYSDYISALNESTNAQNMYTKAIMFALQNSGDQGGTKQALIDQLTKMGYGDQAEGMVGFMDNAGAASGAAARIAAAEKANLKIESELTKLRNQLGSETDYNERTRLESEIRTLEGSRVVLDRQGNYFSGGMGNAGQILGIEGEEGNQLISDYINNLGREAEKAAQKDAYDVGSQMIAAIIQGMDPKTAENTANQIVAPIGEAGEAVKKAFDAAKQGGADAATAFEGAAVVARELNEETATKGISSGQRYASALGQVGGGTEVAKIDRYTQGLAEEDRQGFADFLSSNRGKLGGETGKRFASMSEAAQKQLGAGAAGELVNTDAWIDSAEKGEEASERIIESITSIGTALGDDEDAKEKYVKFILEQEPQDFEDVIPSISDKLKYLNDNVPNEIQKILNVDINNPEQIMGLTTEDIDNLKFMGDAIANLPEEKKELVASIAYDVNGKPKDPKTFLQDLKKQNAAFDKLKSKNPKIRKEAMFDLITLRDGKPADPEKIDQAVKDLEEKFGPGIIKNLPPDQYRKAIEAQYDATQLREQAKGLRAAAKDVADVPGMASGLLMQASQLEAAAAEIEKGAAEAVAAGADSATQPSGGGGGGGGGGEKANPFKDFKKGIVEQIKRFADAGVTLKNLMKAKYNFFNILKMSKGVDDKIRNAGLSPLLAQELMGMDPDQAKKILGKMTNKKGKLTAEGRALQDRFIAGRISGTMSDATDRMDAASRQRRVTADLAARGASFDAISATTGDSERMLQYTTLLDKAANGSKKAKAALDQYIISLEKSSIAEQAAASATEKAVEVAERRRRIDFIDSARSGGIDQGLIEYVSSDAGLMAQYTEAVKKGDKAVADFFEEARTQMALLEKEAFEMNAFDYIANKANEAMDAIRAQFEPEQIRLEDESAAAFEASYGMSKDAAQDLIDKNNVLISQYEQQVNEYERMNAQEQRLIQGHEREKKQWQDKIDSAQDYIDDWQHSIDLLNKQVAERNHQADLLNHELDLMSKAEEGINETYDKRMKALDEVEAVNERILASQRSQLDISKALSTGDVYAAAAAAQQMREQQAQQATTDARDALTAARDAQIEGLTSSGGMTRAQIEEQLWQINQQNYQTSLQIYDLEDKIWQKNQEIYGYKEEIEKIDNLIKEHTDKIFTNNGEILRIQSELIAPLQEANGKWTDRLKSSDLQLAYDKDHLLYQGKTLKSYEEQNRRINAQMKQLDGVRKLADGIYGTWLNVGEAIAEANRIANQDLEKARQGKYDQIKSVDYEQYLAEDGAFDYNAFEEEVNSLRQSKTLEQLGIGEAAIGANYAGGFIKGSGARDSVLSKVAPGEFVIRKAMVDKYGQAMFEKINQGSFSLPRYEVMGGGQNVKPVSVSTTSAPVYNNNYSINVPVNQPNASADEIAYKVMTKIKNIESSSIRRVNGY